METKKTLLRVLKSEDSETAKDLLAQFDSGRLVMCGEGGADWRYRLYADAHGWYIVQELETAS